MDLKQVTSQYEKLKLLNETLTSMAFFIKRKERFQHALETCKEIQKDELLKSIKLAEENIKEYILKYDLLKSEL